MDVLVPFWNRGNLSMCCFGLLRQRGLKRKAASRVVYIYINNFAIAQLATEYPLCKRRFHFTLNRAF